VLMLMGGAVSDRSSPRKIMMRTAWVRAILVTALGLLIWLHLLHTWQLYAMAAAFGTADAFDGPAGGRSSRFLSNRNNSWLPNPYRRSGPCWPLSWVRAADS